MDVGEYMAVDENIEIADTLADDAIVDIVSDSRSEMFDFVSFVA